MKMEKHPPLSARDFIGGVFAGLMGLVLMLALLYWGSAVILDDPAVDLSRRIVFSDKPPTNLRYWLVTAAGAFGLLVARWRTDAPRWLVALPLVWFGWQLVAAAHTVDPALTRATMKHFAACTVFFYLGLFALSRVRIVWPFLAFLLIGFFAVLWTGFNQHYGGLEATRQFYEKLHSGELPPDIQRQYDTPQFQAMFNRPEFQKRIASSRIFGSLMYPNALAGAILLLLPLSLVAVGHACNRFPFMVRGITIGLLGYASAACLVWSGSKSGWLIALVMALAALLRLPLSKRLKFGIIGVALVVGLVGFFVKFAGYFQKGATSVSARFDYWRAAWQISKQHPVVGTGPGTFGVLYKQLKSPESEMAQLTHNDYLEQACDSGFIGFLLYSAMILASLALLYRKKSIGELRIAMWLGSIGLAIQGFLEFGLYIPGLAWPAFLFLGWLWGSGEIKSTTPAPQNNLAGTK